MFRMFFINCCINVKAKKRSLDERSKHGQICRIEMVRAYGVCRECVGCVWCVRGVFVRRSAERRGSRGGAFGVALGWEFTGRGGAG